MACSFPSLTRLATLGVFVSCSPAEQQAATPPEQQAAAAPVAACEVAQAPVNLPGALTEVSGVAASRVHAGTFWTHNDSGSGSVIYSVDSRGRRTARIEVEGAANNDWEDIAVGPCAGGDCLYLADIGDNNASRNDLEIYRIAEPAPDAGSTGNATELKVRYPGGPRDAEALFVLPGERVYLVTKGDGAPIEVYQIPGSFADASVRRGGRGAIDLERVASLTAAPVDLAGRITGAGASADGTWVVLRTLVSLQFYRSADLLGGRTGNPIVVDLKPLQEAQGEGVAIGAEGLVYVTSEGSLDGLPGTLAILRCPHLLQS